MANVVVNAIGDVCPLPVVKTLKALKEMKGSGTLEVHVDNDIAVQNVLRMAQNHGLSAKSEKLSEKDFQISIHVPGETVSKEADITCTPDVRGDYVVKIGSDCMGEGSEELGKKLLKGFVFALTQQEVLPKTVLLFNGGAHLSCEGSESLEDLQKLEAQGVEILTCGTCLDFYGLKEKLRVGTVTNMYVIVETLRKAGRVVAP